MFIKALILDRDESVAKVLGYLVDLFRASVGIGGHQFCQFVALGVIDHCCKALRKDGCGIHVGCRTQDSFKSTDTKAYTDYHDRQGADQYDLQCGDKEQFFEFYGF